MPSGSSSSRAKKAPIEQPATIDRGSGNVFADLDLPDSDIALAKAELVQHIRAIVGGRKLTIANAADLLGIDESKISALLRGRVEIYSIDRLVRFLSALDHRVEITVTPNPARPQVVRPG